MNHPTNRNAAALTLCGALITALGACSADGPEAAPPPSDPAETTSPAADCPPITEQHIDLDPGCWALEAPGLPAAQLRLPAGFVGQPGAFWLPTDLEDADWGHLAITTTGNVFPDSCTRSAPPSNSATVSDFVDALAAQAVTISTEPARVSLGGHDGFQLTLRTSPDVDASRCTEAGLATWQVGDGELAGIDPDTVLRLWVVDVDGAPVVLVMTTRARGTKETVDLLTGIVETATFAGG